MTQELNWFTVRLALLGVPANQVIEGTHNLQDDLRMRPHLRNAKVWWETETHQLIVQVDIQDLRADQAAEQMAEELLEAAVGALKEFEAIHVDVLDAYVSQTP